MDIRLPGMDGMQAARQLRQKDHTVLLVFLTSLAQYAVEGYEVEAVDYIIKPITYSALRLKLPRLLRRCATEEKEILIQSVDQYVKLCPRDLLYVEIFDHHIQYMTQNGVIRAYGTLKEIEDALPKEFFSGEQSDHCKPAVRDQRGRRQCDGGWPGIFPEPTAEKELPGSAA